MQILILQITQITERITHLEAPLNAIAYKRSALTGLGFLCDVIYRYAIQTEPLLPSVNGQVIEPENPFNQEPDLTQAREAIEFFRTNYIAPDISHPQPLQPLLIADDRETNKYTADLEVKIAEVLQSARESLQSYSADCAEMDLKNQIQKLIHNFHLPSDDDIATNKLLVICSVVSSVQNMNGLIDVLQGLGFPEKFFAKIRRKINEGVISNSVTAEELLEVIKKMKCRYDERYQIINPEIIASVSEDQSRILPNICEHCVLGQRKWERRGERRVQRRAKCLGFFSFLFRPSYHYL